MNMQFADAIRAAMALTRAQKLTEATRLIQDALAGGNQASDMDAAEERVVDLTPNPAERSITASGHGPAGREFEGLPQRRSSAPLEGLAGRLQKAGLPGLNLDGLAGVKARKPIEIPDGAQFLSRTFVCAAGSRSYKLYVPRHRLPGKRPLIVMLHGGTQDADDFAAGTRMNHLAEELGVVVAYPSQSKAANASLCWNWFKPEHQQRGRGEPAILAGITQEIIAGYDIDPRRVFVAGLSAGGAMAAVIGATYPDIYAAVGIHSGLAYKSAADVASAFAAMRGDRGQLGQRQRRCHGAASDVPPIRTIVFQGDADHIVDASNAAKIVAAQAQFGGHAVSAKAGSHGSRRYTRTVTRDPSGLPVVEQWLVHGSGHAWSGGSPEGTYTDPQGPDASREMLRFFMEEKVKPAV